jgi:hemoglobin
MKTSLSRIAAARNSEGRYPPRRFLLSIAALIVLVGCGTGKTGNENEEFFTSGSRSADQRASQKMAKEQQLANSEPGKAQAEKKLSLFDRLGGQQGIGAIVDDFIQRAVQDPRVNWQRTGAKHKVLFGRDESVAWQATPENVARLKEHLVQFVSLTTGGPANYDGKTIKDAHANMGITNPEFDATIGDLKASLDKLQVGEREQKELLAIVESTRPQIVTER